MEKIDFVVTWVDGNDPEWQKEKAKYQKNTAASDGRNVRYREWDMLRYWFRSVETYAPWVNKIHFVTCGHLPKWLNTDNPKLHVVKHTDFIPEEYLPTFSSHPIELNLHRIPGLSSQFVYFNDDFYLTAPVTPEDFFVKGVPCDSLEESIVRLSERSQMVYIKSNDICFTNMHFNKKEAKKKMRSKWYSLKTPSVALRNLLRNVISRQYFFGLNVHHLPQAYRKETFDAVWNADPNWLSETCSHKFRDDQDVSQCVFKFWQLASGNFHPYNKRKHGFFYVGGSDPKPAAKAIRTQLYKFICYNDGDDIDFDYCKETMHSAFEDTFPNKSSFEK